MLMMLHFDAVCVCLIDDKHAVRNMQEEKEKDGRTSLIIMIALNIKQGILSIFFKSLLLFT